MKSANFIRVLCVAIAVIFGVVVFSAPEKRTAADSEKCTEEAKEKCDEKDSKTRGDIMLWESIGRHLLSSR